MSNDTKDINYGKKTSFVVIGKSTNFEISIYVKSTYAVTFLASTPQHFSPRPTPELHNVLIMAEMAKMMDSALPALNPD